MNVWMVRGGKHGEHESISLDKGLTCIGFSQVPDLHTLVNRECMRDCLKKTYPEATEAAISNFLGQLFSFVHRMEKGDIIALPLKNQPQIALGQVAGDYEYRTDLGEYHHTRKVQWQRPDAPRSQFGQDLLARFGAIMTVCQIKGNTVPERIQSIMQGKSDPGHPPDTARNGEIENDLPIDIEQAARDQVRLFMQTHYKGHDLARLVDAVLQAEGYKTLLSPPGPDGGVDILARRGALGLEGPGLCVQVKSSNSPVDVTVLRGLQGTMATFKADEGLLVSWGGYNQAVLRESRHSFFNLRLWSADDLLLAVQKNYERLPEEIQNELPLKRIWAMVPQAEEE